MARRNEATRQPAVTEASDARQPREPRQPEWLTFVSDGEEHRVDMRAPLPRQRDGRWMVDLMDLWVASLLPDDFLDLRFEIVTAGPGGTVRCSPVEPLEFARGRIDLEERQLWWDAPEDNPLNGHRALSIVVLRREPSHTEPLPQIASTKPEVHRIKSVADLQRLLPHVPRVYPRVEVRSASTDEVARRAG